MKRLLQKREFCHACNKMTKDEEYSEECNYCKKEIDWNRNNGFPFSLSFVGKYDNPKGDTADANFCSFKCCLNWIKDKKYEKYDLLEHFFSCYLHIGEMEELCEILNKTLGDKS